MSDQELAQKILEMIDQHKRETMSTFISTQYLERGKCIDQIEQFCFREALKGNPEVEMPVAQDPNTCTFTITESFLKAYSEYLQRISAQNPGKNFVMELRIPLNSSATAIPGIHIVEVKL